MLWEDDFCELALQGGRHTVPPTAAFPRILRELRESRQNEGGKGRDTGSPSYREREVRSFVRVHYTTQPSSVVKLVLPD